MSEKPVEDPVEFHEGKNGGRLRIGGTNRGGTGRTPNVLRRGFRKKLPVELRALQDNLRDIETEIAALQPIRAKERGKADRHTKRVSDLERLMRARMQLVDFLAKYGLGTTITETDTEGNDVVIRVKREPRSLIADN